MLKYSNAQMLRSPTMKNLMLRSQMLGSQMLKYSYLKCSNAQISDVQMFRSQTMKILMLRSQIFKCSDLRRWEREFPPRLRPLFQVNWQYISQFDLEFNLTWNSRFLISNRQLNCQYISKFDLEFNILKFQRQMYSILNSQLVGKKSMINFYF